VLIALSNAAIPAGGQAMADAERVRAFVSNRFPHGVPLAAAKQLGPSAGPILRALLVDPSRVEEWPVIVATLGYIGGPDSFAALRRFLEESSGEVSEPAFRALTTVPLALGDLARDGDTAAERYLVAGMNARAWLDRPLAWTFRTYRGDRQAVLMARLSVNGIGRIGTELAAETLRRRLEESERDGTAGTIGPNIQDSLRLIERIRREGAARVFSETAR
jgi:HEAT repeat protein